MKTETAAGVWLDDPAAFIITEIGWNNRWFLFLNSLKTERLARQLLIANCCASLITDCAPAISVLLASFLPA